MTTINTKAVANRRSVHFETFDDLLHDIEGVAQAVAAGRVRPLGNWSPGQNLQHLAKFLACSLDGFGGELPFGIRVLGRVLRVGFGKRLFIKPVPPGLKLPAGTPYLPGDEVEIATGASDLQEQVERVRSGAAFIPASPFFGTLSREQWIELHLRHAELHMSFIGIDDKARPPA